METHPGPHTTPGERSLGELFRKLSEESSQLIRQELALARAELRENVGELRKDAPGLLIGGALAAVGALALVAFLIAILGEALGGEYWLSALIVAVLMLAAGAWLALRAVRRMREIRLAPEQTLTSLRTTQHWASEEAAELRAALAAGGNGSGNGAGRVAGRSHLASAATGTGPVNRIRGVHEAPVAEPAATHVGEAPSRGSLTGLLKVVWKEIQDDDITGQAAKVAYYAFLSLPPALMAVFGLAGLFGSVDMARTIQQEAQLALPASVTETIINPFIEQVLLEKAPGPFSLGLLLALWGGSSVFVGLMTTLNHAYDVEEDRSWIKQRGTAMGVMIAGAIGFLVSAVALLAGPHISDALGLGSFGRTVWALLQWPMAFAFITAAFWVGYYVLPNRDQRAGKGVLLKAAAAAALVWVAATAAFRLYIANFSSYSETYGFLGAFIVLLLWLYVTALVVLAGGELASEMEKR